MSWAFLETMKSDVNWNISYVQVRDVVGSVRCLGSDSHIKILQNARYLLQQRYSQVPQLSCGFQFDLNNPYRI